MKIPILVVAALALTIYLGGCNTRKVNYIKSQAQERWEKAGFEIVGYEGYETGNIFTTPGGRVWYIVKRNGVTYDGFLSAWGDEIHIYNLRALDALSDSKGN
jgi:hypothetical protein